jgi:hypothetical protein
MPEGRIERLICFAALVTLGFLLALTVPRWQDYVTSKPAAGGLATSSASPGELPAPRTAISPGRATEQRASALVETALRFAAERGECWLEVRERGEEGRVLFAGTLVRGRSVTLRGSSFWVRMGAGQNLSARFGKHALADLPAGAATVSIERATVDVIALG